MGSAAFRNYVRNDRIVGQGKEILAVSKLLNLKNIDLDRIFHEFAKYEDAETHLVDLKLLFQRIRVPYDLYAKIFFQVLDKTKSEHLDFMQFLVRLPKVLHKSAITYTLLLCAGYILELSFSRREWTSKFLLCAIRF